MKLAITLFLTFILVFLSGCASLQHSPKVTTATITAPSFNHINPTIIAPEIQVEEITLPSPIRPLHERAVIRHTEAELQCFARAIYLEARGEGERGMAAVGYVILNRMGSGKYPPTACGVVHQKFKVRGVLRCQFSWSCNNMRNATLRGKSYEDSLAVAKQVMALSIANPIDDSIYFNISKLRPSHTSRNSFRARIGNHDFYAAI